MREIKTEEIKNTIASLCMKANFELRRDVLDAIGKALEKEESALGKEVLETLLKNAEIAKARRMPICQDTGYVTVFLRVGQEIKITGGSVREAVNEGVRKGYEEGYLRKSLANDPCFSRENTGDNTPPVIFTDIIEGDSLRITVMPKGGGGENVSALKMAKLSDCASQVKEFVLETVKRAGARSCPPLVIGIGVGGSFDSVGILAKKALLRSVDSNHPNPEYARLEKQLLNEINSLGIGPGGTGGAVTALGVNIENFPTHIATLPVAINVSCHALRSAQGVL